MGVNRTARAPTSAASTSSISPRRRSVTTCTSPRTATRSTRRACSQRKIRFSTSCWASRVRPVPVFAFASLRSTDAQSVGLGEVGVISDAQLLALAAESQRDALDALYSAYKSRIYTYLLRFLADPELADDVTQETFTKAFNALPKLDRGTKVLPWLYRVASNCAIDHIRRRKRFQWLRMSAIEATPAEPHARDAGGEIGERGHWQAGLRRGLALSRPSYGPRGRPGPVLRRRRSFSLCESRRRARGGGGGDRLGPPRELRRLSWRRAPLERPGPDRRRDARRPAFAPGR